MGELTLEDIRDKEQLKVIRAKEQLKVIRIKEAKGGGTPVEDPTAMGLTPEPTENTVLDEVGGVVAKAGRGIVDTAQFIAEGVGYPIDAINLGLQKLGLPMPKVNPYGGQALSQGMENLFEATGVNKIPQLQTPVGKFMGGVAEFAGASVVPLGLAKRFKDALSIGGPMALQMQKALTEKFGKVVVAELLASFGAQTGKETAQTFFPENAGAEIAGTLMGAVTPAGLGGVVRRVIRGPKEAAKQALKEFNAVNIQPTAGQISKQGVGGPLESTIAKIPGGRGILDSAEETRKQLGTTIKELTGNVSAERAGRVIHTGLFGDTGFTKRFSDQASTLFNKLKDKIPPETRSLVNNTIKIFDELASPISGVEPLSRALSNPKVLEISDAFRKSVDGGTLPFGAILDTRSAIGRMLSSSEVISQAPRAEIKRIYAALSQDLSDAATNAGALKVFTRADNYYKAGIKRVDDFLARLSKNSGTPEQIFIQSTQGRFGASKIRSIRRSLKPEEWEIVARTHLSRLGRATGGKADELDAFSPETFFTNLANMSPEARNAVFGGVKGLGKSIEDLNKAAARLRAYGKTGANPSGTSMGFADTATFAAIGAGAATQSLIPIIVAATIAAGASVGAYLFSNPAFVSWLAKGSNLIAAQIPGHIARLGVVAKNNPDLKADISLLLESMQQ